MLVTRQIELLHLATYEVLKLLSVAFHFSTSYTPYSRVIAIFVISFVYVNWHSLHRLHRQKSKELLKEALSTNYREDKRITKFDAILE